jgi:molybdenum cofactor cytidylyltransferase
VLAAIVLAAGESTRMGTPKALLQDSDGHPFVGRLARTFHSAGIDEIIVVTGTHHAAVVAALEDDRLPAVPRIVRNADPSRGQLSSLWAGLDAAGRPDLEAILMTLVDVPMVKDTTVRAVVDAWRRGRAPIVRPAVGERHGHPVLFDRSVFDELRGAPLAGGAKTVVHAHEETLLNVQVDDEGSVTDIDTPADYDALLQRSKRS